jgi:hypothetical protein
MRILLEKHKRKKEGHIHSRRKEVASPTLASKQGKKKESIIYEVTDDDVLTGVRRYVPFSVSFCSSAKAMTHVLNNSSCAQLGLQRQDCERNLAEGVSYVELTPDEARQKTRDVFIRLCKGKR